MKLNIKLHTYIHLIVLIHTQMKGNSTSDTPLRTFKMLKRLSTLPRKLFKYIKLLPSLSYTGMCMN